MQDSKNQPTWIGQESTWEPMSDEMRAKVEKAKKEHMELIQKTLLEYWYGIKS